MRAIVSTIGTPPYGISQYLVKLIQPTLNKSKYKITNSSSFVNEAKDWLVKRDEVQVSYDIVNLYPSVPINKALDVLMDQLNSDKDDLMKRTKLCLKDIYELAELCLNKCYFLWNSEIRILKNSGPIGLSFMVVLSESYVQNLEQKAIAEGLTLNLAPTTYRRYVDDTHARFESKGQSREFQKILNKQDKHIQFTIEDENGEKCLNFLDIKIKNNNGRYEFNVHRKPAITNVQIKPHSCIPPDTVTSIFKGFLARATKIYSGKYLKEEIEYLTDIFCENGHDRKTLKKIINEFEKKTRTTINTTNNNNANKKQTITVPWTPKIGPKIKKEIQKFGFRVAFKTGPNLNSILCKNKDKLMPNSYPGVYELKCSCGSAYNGETKKKVITRSIEHQQGSIKGNWTSSGATEHTKEYHGCFDWLHPKTLSIKNSYYDRKVRESLEIDMAVVKYGQEKVLNRDNGNFVKTNAWKPLFRKMKTLH